MMTSSMANSISGCVNTTITPNACGSNGCSVTFYRAGTTYGITLLESKGVHGVYGFTALPTSVRFASIVIAPNGTAVVGTGLDHHRVTSATITGVTGAQFFSTCAMFGTARSISTNTPIGITGTITARSEIKFGVSYNGAVQTVNVNEIINNSGVSVNLGRPGNGAITVNLCAPK
jgi:hypothetical protein